LAEIAPKNRTIEVKEAPRISGEDARSVTVLASLRGASQPRFVPRRAGLFVL